MEHDAPKEQELKSKRTRLIIGLWEYLSKIGLFDKNEITLCYPLLNDITEHYIRDYNILKYRYNIPNLIEREKIAGLMAALIVRYRPIHLVADDYSSEQAIYANETLAILNGLSICCEDSITEIAEIMQQQWFEKWFTDFQYFLHYRNYTPESLIMIFKTIMLFVKTK